MRKVFLTKIKKMLNDERTQIVNRSKTNANTVIDIDGDETDEIQGKILALTNTQLVVRDKEKIIKIDNALRRITDGSFGSCEECGEDISEKRLLVNPGFSTCISCAEQIELMRKRNMVR